MLGIYLELSCYLHFTDQKVETCVLKSHNLELAEVGFEPWSVWPQFIIIHFYLFSSVRLIATIQHDNRPEQRSENNTLVNCIYLDFLDCETDMIVLGRTLME